MCVGFDDGFVDGRFVSFASGLDVGVLVCFLVGLLEGLDVGVFVGLRREGLDVGFVGLICVGLDVGAFIGFSENDGLPVGFIVFILNTNEMLFPEDVILDMLIPVLVTLKP